MKKLISLILMGCLLLTPAVVSSEIRQVGVTKASVTEVMITGEITEASFEEFMETTAYREQHHFNLYIHTNGGTAYSTIAIMNRIAELKRRGCTFKTIVYGKAFSAGGFLFLMGDERVVYETSTLMFHTMLQQVKDDIYGSRESKIAEGKKSYPSTIAMMERLDRTVTKRFCEITGLKEDSVSARYWLYGEMPDGSTVQEGAQYMSARTALSMGVATQLIEY